MVDLLAGIIKEDEGLTRFDDIGGQTEAQQFSQIRIGEEEPPRATRNIVAGLTTTSKPLPQKEISQVSEIEGFRHEDRTDSWFVNAALDVKQMGNDYLELFEAIKDDPVTTLSNVVTQLPEAIVTQYKRWVDAADNGVFIDALKQHPVQFIADISPVLSLGASSGAGIARTIGASAG